jgi:amino acid transporter
MDHEKPQAVSPQIFEYVGDQHSDHQHNSLVMSDLSPDNSETLYGHAPSINEPENVEDRRERRGESLWFVLH